MSSPLAIGAVSAVLRNLLDNGLIEQVALGTTREDGPCTAPDTIKLDNPDDPPQLNVFLYQATPNAALRNQSLPSRAPNGTRLTNPPLALDLHYLTHRLQRAATSTRRSCSATRCICCTSGRCWTRRDPPRVLTPHPMSAPRRHRHARARRSRGWRTRSS